MKETVEQMIERLMKERGLKARGPKIWGLKQQRPKQQPVTRVPFDYLDESEYLLRYSRMLETPVLSKTKKARPDVVHNSRRTV